MGPRVTEVSMVHFDFGVVIKWSAKLGQMKQWRFVRTFVHGTLVEPYLHQYELSLVRPSHHLLVVQVNKDHAVNHKCQCE
jgi:hypothetical protein